jgi:hypothetical protein
LKLTVKIYPGGGHGLEQRDAHGPLHNPDAPSVEGFPADMVAWFKGELGGAN